jgi:hypothetical protein
MLVFILISGLILSSVGFFLSTYDLIKAVQDYKKEKEKNKDAA